MKSLPLFKIVIIKWFCGSIKALENRDIEYNWCVNLYNDKESFAKTTKPFYDEYFKEWQTLQEYICNFYI